MTKAELRKTKGYKEAVQKIENYPKGFTFTLYWNDIPKAKGNALKIVLDDCINKGILECISIGLNISGEIVDEKYRKL